jgi:hypothetical protein
MFVGKNWVIFGCVRDLEWGVSIETHKLTRFGEARKGL